MFGLVWGLYEYLIQREEISFVIIGVDGAGKTCVLESLKGLYTSQPGLEHSKIVSTVGLNMGRVDAHGGQLVFWDLGGKADLRSIWDKYFAESHAVIYVVDAAAPQRLTEARSALEQALGSRELYDAPLLVLANKQDSSAALSGDEVTEQLGLSTVISRPCRVQTASALNGDGLKEGLEWLVHATKRSNRALLLRQRQQRNGRL
eukprot:jgi/Astpho2/2104/Aster-00586